MTYKERLQIEYPECIDEKGECNGCPEDYEYLPKHFENGRGMCAKDYGLECQPCWNEEIDKENMLEELEEFYNKVAEIAQFISKELKEHIEKETTKIYLLNDEELEEKYRLMASVRKTLF